MLFCSDQRRSDSEAVLSVGLFVLYKFLEFCWQNKIIDCWRPIWYSFCKGRWSAWIVAAWKLWEEKQGEQQERMQKRSSCQDTERAPDPFLRESQRPPGWRENLSYQDDPFSRRDECKAHLCIQSPQRTTVRRTYPARTRQNLYPSTGKSHQTLKKI